jgi:hypothetical protein
MPRRDHCQTRLLRELHPSNSTSWSTASDSDWSGITNKEDRGTDASSAVKAVVTYFRTNVAQEVIAELLFVGQSTLSRTISDLEELSPRRSTSSSMSCPKKSRVGSEWSTERCVRSGPGPMRLSCTPEAQDHWPRHQFVCDLFGDLMHISDPLPGNTTTRRPCTTLALMSSSAMTTL